MSGDLAPQLKAPRWPGDTRPDFAEGNVVALKHGAHSPRVRQPLEEAMVEWAREAFAWLAEPRYAPSVAAWVRSEAIVLLLSAYVDEHGVIDADGKVLPAVAQLDRYERLAKDHRIRLAIDPTAELHILRERMAAEQDKADLDAVMAAGRAAREAIEAEQADGDGDDAA